MILWGLLPQSIALVTSVFTSPTYTALLHLPHLLFSLLDSNYVPSLRDMCMSLNWISWSALPRCQLSFVLSKHHCVVTSAAPCTQEALPIRSQSRLIGFFILVFVYLLRRTEWNTAIKTWLRLWYLFQILGLSYCPMKFSTHLDLSLSLVLILCNFWNSFHFCFVFMQHACKRALYHKAELYVCCTTNLYFLLLLRQGWMLNNA